MGAGMGYLLFVTLIQAFSFSLIGVYLAGHVDSYFAVLVRVVLAGLVRSEERRVGKECPV